MRPTLNVQPVAGGRGSLASQTAAPAAPVSVWAKLDSVPHRAFFLAGVLAAFSQGLWWALVWLLAASLAYTSARWGLYASLQNRLLAMLHFSFVWLVPALLLQAAAALGWPVGSAPVHALGLGFAGTMLMAFVTRVSLGHSGRPLQADNGFVALYVLLHAVALLRVGLALAGSHTGWLALASLAWLAVLLAWAARVVPMYLQARLDGKAG